MSRVVLRESGIFYSSEGRVGVLVISRPSITLVKIDRGINA